MPTEGSALEDDVERTPGRLVEEVREELRQIDEAFKYRDGIEATIARQDAVLRLTLWAVGRLARMMSNADRKAPNAPHELPANGGSREPKTL